MAEEGLNRVMLIGRTCADPELRFTQSNQGVLSLRIACTKTWLDNNSKEKKDRTEFINVVVWGKRGEALNKILGKGSRIAVEGEMQTRSYEAKDGSGKRYATEVVASNIILLGGKGEGQRRDDGDPQSHHSQSGADYPDAPNDDDIPF